VKTMWLKAENVNNGPDEEELGSTDASIKCAAAAGDPSAHPEYKNSSKAPLF